MPIFRLKNKKIEKNSNMMSVCIAVMTIIVLQGKMKGGSKIMARDNDNITKTCLRIDVDTWKKFKIMCINQGISANELLTKMVNEKIKQMEELNSEC